MITYKDGPGYFNVHVFVDGKRVGSILKTAAGWQYKTQGQSGDYFPTLQDCKQSLETI